jgi:AraC-like DNA-binding protein
VPLASLNPPASRLGHINAILSGRARRYHVGDFPGPLSLKTVTRGIAEWTAAGKRFRVTPADLLILNDGQNYSITIDSAQTVETFCVFFARGYVEDAYRSVTSSSGALLDDPFAPGRLCFFERRYAFSPTIGRILAALRGAHDDNAVEEHFRALAGAVLGLREETQREVASVPAARAATRAELYRRLIRGKEYLDDCIAERVRLDDAAREACLSAFHFHRLFRAAFGRTPHEYLQTRRLEHAARRLHSSEDPVELIAAESGFASVTSFTTLFRRRKGVPPGAWRRAR